MQIVCAGSDNPDFGSVREAIEAAAPLLSPVLKQVYKAIREEVDVDILFNRALVRDYVCAQCGAGLIKIYDDGWKVVCAENRSHEGRIRKSTVEMRQQQSRLEGMEVAMAYPELVPPKRHGSVAKDLQDLFG